MILLKAASLLDISSINFFMTTNSVYILGGVTAPIENTLMYNSTGIIENASEVVNSAVSIFSNASLGDILAVLAVGYIGLVIAMKCDELRKAKQESFSTTEKGQNRESLTLVKEDVNGIALNHK